MKEFTDSLLAAAFALIISFLPLFTIKLIRSYFSLLKSLLYLYASFASLYAISAPSFFLDFVHGRCTDLYIIYINSTEQNQNHPVCMHLIIFYSILPFLHKFIKHITQCTFSQNLYNIIVQFDSWRYIAQCAIV